MRWQRVAPCLAAAGLAAPVGARLLHAAAAGDLSAVDTAVLLRPAAGDFSLYGGLLLAAAVGWVVCRWLGEDPMAVLDASAPAVAIGIAILRVGCFLAGCCFGVPTDLPWGATYPPGSSAHLHQMARSHPLLAVARGPEPVHPIPLYEIAVALAGAALAAWALRRHARPGTAMAVLLAWYSAWRLVLHPLRAPPPAPAAPDWLYPVLYAAAAAGALLWLAAPAVFRLKWYPGRSSRPPP